MISPERMALISTNEPPLNTFAREMQSTGRLQTIIEEASVECVCVCVCVVVTARQIIKSTKLHIMMERQ